MRTNLFTTSATFKLCGLDADGNLVDTEDITIQNLPISELTYLNSIIKQVYLTAQKEATKNWTSRDRKEFMELAMSHLVGLSVGTKEGNRILFETEDGILHYTWVFVKHRFPSIQEWDKILRSNLKVYGEIMSRFNQAVLDLAILTSQELEAELPETANTEAIDDRIAALITCGLSKEEAMKLTIDQADKIIEIKYPSIKKTLAAGTNNPEEFKEMLKQTLEANNEHTE